MNVAELIDFLKTLPQDHTVMVYGHDLESELDGEFRLFPVNLDLIYISRNAQGQNMVVLDGA